MVRAIMEGVAFSYMSIIDHLEGSGFRISEMRETGEPTKSDLWNQISADICGVPISLIESLAEAPVGDVMIGGVATGIFTSFEDAINKTIKLGKKYEPDPKNKKVYDDLYKINMDLYKGLFDSYSALANTGK